MSELSVLELGFGLFVLLPGFVFVWTFLVASGRTREKSYTELTAESAIGSVAVLSLLTLPIVLLPVIRSSPPPDLVALIAGLPEIYQLSLYAGVLTAALLGGIAVGRAERLAYYIRTGNRRYAAETFDHLMRLKRSDMYATLRLKDPDERVYGKVVVFDRDSKDLTLTFPFRIPSDGSGGWQSLGTHLYVPGERIVQINTTVPHERGPTNGRDRVREWYRRKARLFGGRPKRGTPVGRRPDALPLPDGGSAPPFEGISGENWSATYQTIRPWVTNSKEYTVRGWIENTTDIPLAHGELAVYFVDKDRIQIGEAEAVLENLRPGIRYGFELTYPGSNPYDVDRFQIRGFAAY